MEATERPPDSRAPATATVRERGAASLTVDLRRLVARLLPAVALSVLVGCAGGPGAFGQMDGPPVGATSQREAVAGGGASSLSVSVPTGEWVCPDEALAPSYDATMFVAADGSDGNDGRSAERPVETLQRAADLAEPGDVVWVRDGVYSSDVEFTTSGTADAPIVFESQPGECAILDGAGNEPGRRVTFDSVDHTVFRNFVVRNSPAEGLFLEDSNENVLTNLRLHDNFYSGITNLGGDRNRFAYIISHDNMDTRGVDADGISISSGDGNVVSHCVVYGNSDDGVDTWRSTHTVVERCVAFRNGRRNGDGNGFKAGGAGGTVNTVVRYSIAFQNRSNGFDYNTGGRVTFDHNTSFANGRYGFVVSGGTLRNNLSIDNERGTWYGDLSNADAAGNSWDSEFTEAAFASTALGSEDFLVLRDESRAVDAGVDLGESFDGAAPDLGALPQGETIGSSIRIELSGLSEP